MKTLAILIPGIGYTCDMPLLYYSKKLLNQYSIDTLVITLHGLIKDDLESAFTQGMMQTKEQLLAFDIDRISSYERIIFITKSIGTGIAGTIQAEWKKIYGNDMNDRIRNIYFTPVRQYAHTLHTNSITFHGTKDTWIETPNVVCECKKKDIPLYITEGANHSMETGNVQQNIEIMKTIMHTSEKYLKKWLNE